MVSYEFNGDSDEEIEDIAKLRNQSEAEIKFVIVLELRSKNNLV